MKNTAGAILIAACLIVGALIQRESTQAAVVEAVAKPTPQIPFAGRMSPIYLCCNGIEFSNTSEFQTVAKGTFMFEFDNMVPNPVLGTGLYSWWNLLPRTKILGGAKPVGQCQEILSYCNTPTPTDWSVMQMGTTLVP